jgi:hypothetical protein
MRMRMIERLIAGVWCQSEPDTQGKDIRDGITNLVLVYSLPSPDMASIRKATS